MSKRPTQRLLASLAFALAPVAIAADGPSPGAAATTASATHADGSARSTPSPVPPNGPGGAIGQQQTTHLNCVTTKLSGAPTKANISWSWTWLPQSEAGGPGGDEPQCPCAWRLQSETVQFRADDGEPLDC